VFYRPSFFFDRFEIYEKTRTVERSLRTFGTGRGSGSVRLIGITATIYDADGIEQEFYVETEILIKPLNEADFRVEMAELEEEQLDDIEFCKQEDLEPTACMKWGVTEMMGLSI
jgi:hypothetical protein